jgi:hypothetical protein
MSDSLGRFVSLAVPDVAEAAGKYMNQQQPPQKKPRKSRLTPTPATPALGKQESPVSAPTNLKPDEVQAGLDAELVKIVDAQTTPERKSEVLIKIGLYRNELSKYLPMIRDADEALAKQVLETWFEAGDGHLKKALVNSEAGSEEFPLAKSAPEQVGPEIELAKMLDDATGPRRMVLAQNIGAYTHQLQDALAKMEEIRISDIDRDAAIAGWVDAGDGSHRDLKKFVAAAEVNRRLAKMSEADVVDEHAGNAPSHVGSKLGVKADSRLSYAHNGSGEGAGPRLRGTQAVPEQNDGEDIDVGSGPNDTGGGEATVGMKIRRKGTTGGLGSVGGAETDGSHLTEENDEDNVETSDATYDDETNSWGKNADLAVELVKIAPGEMIEALETLEPDDQVEVMEIGAQHAADLMAWSAQTGDQLQKSALDSAVADWLGADPDTIQLKKWVAEALGTAEEIPLGLAKAIMSWTPPGTEDAPRGVRLRARYATA